MAFRQILLGGKPVMDMGPITTSQQIDFMRELTQYKVFEDQQPIIHSILDNLCAVKAQEETAMKKILDDIQRGNLLAGARHIPE